MTRPSFQEQYERRLVPSLFRPWAAYLLDVAELSPGEAILDIACGTGIVARTAALRLGAPQWAVGVDSDPAMLAVARSVAPEIDWREGDALALPVFADEKFDLATCQQGLQFFTDKVKGLVEMRRALKPGGRAAVTTWRPVIENPLFYELQLVAEKRVGPIEDSRHSFGDAVALRKAMDQAGFGEVDIETVARETTFEEPLSFLEMNTAGLVGMSGLARELRTEAIAAVLDDSLQVVERYTVGGVMSFELRANLAIARR